MIKTMLIAASVLLIAPNFINKDINEQLPYNGIERFDPSLAYITSTEKLEAHTDSLALQQGIQQGTIDYGILLEDVVSRRFFHGFSHWKLNENWIAAIGERVTGIGLSCKVRPEMIMEHPNAACSQQEIVLMQVLRNKNMIYRKVGFPHHYALEILDQGKWYYIDANMEPAITKEQRIESNWGGMADNLKQYYNQKEFTDLDSKFGMGLHVWYGPQNEVPARNLKIFLAISGVLSKILWLFPLLILWARAKYPMPRFASAKLFSRKSRQPVLSAV